MFTTQNSVKYFLSGTLNELNETPACSDRTFGIFASEACTVAFLWMLAYIIDLFSKYSFRPFNIYAAGLFVFMQPLPNGAWSSHRLTDVCRNKKENKCPVSWLCVSQSIDGAREFEQISCWDKTAVHVCVWVWGDALNLLWDWGCKIF